MPKRKAIDPTKNPKLTSQLATARDALEGNLKRLLRKHIPDAPRNYPKALTKMCPTLSITSAKRYVGQLPDDYSYPNLVVLIEMAEAFRISLFELLDGVHSANRAHDEPRAEALGGGGQEKERLRLVKPESKQNMALSPDLELA